MASIEQREGDWSEDDFAQMDALYVYEANLCPACGRPIDECRDPNLAVMVDDGVCRYTAAGEVARRSAAAKHKGEKPKAGQPFWSDGLLQTPRPMTDAEFERYAGRPRSIHERQEG